MKGFWKVWVVYLRDDEAKHLWLLGGSWAVISGVISLLIWIISEVTLLITPRITTHEPPSTLIFIEL